MSEKFKGLTAQLLMIDALIFKQLNEFLKRINDLLFM